MRRIPSWILIYEAVKPVFVLEDERRDLSDAGIPLNLYSANAVFSDVFGPGICLLEAGPGNADKRFTKSPAFG